MTRASALFAVSVLMAGCTNQLILDKGDALAALPRQLTNSGHFVVDLHVNGRGPFVFALDTAASISVVFDEVREKAGITPATDKQIVVHGMFEHGSYPLALVDSITLGSEKIESVRAAVLPGGSLAGAGIDGLLGVDVLSRYALGFSHSDQVLRLYNKELVSERSYLGWATVPLSESVLGEDGPRAYSFDIAIVSEQLPALFDLGSNVSLMNSAGARSIGVRQSRLSHGSEVAGAFGASSASVELDVGHVRIANLQWRNRNFLVVDLPFFEKLGFDEKPVAIVGTDFFQERDFIIDFERRRLLIRASD